MRKPRPSFRPRVETLEDRCVPSVNHAPLGVSHTVNTSSAYTFQPSDFGFSDPNDSPANNFIAVKINNVPVFGTLTNNGTAVTYGQTISVSDISTSKLVYTPGTGSSDSFNFQVQDDGGTAYDPTTMMSGQDTDPTAKSMNITITSGGGGGGGGGGSSGNHAPIGVSKTVTMLQNTTFTFSTTDFGFSDPNDSPANSFLAVRITNVPVFGSLMDGSQQVTYGQYISVTDIAANMLVFTPTTNTSGSDYAGFKFQVQDNGGGTSDTDPLAKDVTINVIIPPTAGNAGVYYVLMNHDITISDLNTYGNSFNSDSLTPSILQGPGSGTLVDFGGGQFKYTGPNYVVSDAFTYKLNDGLADSNNALVSINVVDQPIVANNVRLPISGLYPVVITSVDLLKNSQSVVPYASLQVGSVSSPLLGQLTTNADGTWTYTPPSAATAPINAQDSFAFTITDGVNTATAFCMLLVPDRQPLGPPPVPPRDNRDVFMANVTNLFPQGVNIANFNAMAPAQQATLNQSLADSIHQGYSGDSAVASNLIATIRQKGFAWLNNTITERYNPQNQLIGYEVKFAQDPQAFVLVFTPVDIAIPTQAQRAIYGYAGSAALGTSLWYTVYEMAYVQQYGGAGAQVIFTTIGNYFQPVASAANSLAVLRLVAGPPTVGQSFTLANIQQNALVAQLSNATAIMTAATTTTFTQPQQARATLLGIYAGHNYAIIGYDAMNSQVTLRNPYNMDGVGGGQFTISLVDFQLLFGSLTTNA